MEEGKGLRVDGNVEKGTEGTDIFKKVNQSHRGGLREKLKRCPVKGEKRNGIRKERFAYSSSGTHQCEADLFRVQH